MSGWSDNAEAAAQEREREMDEMARMSKELQDQALRWSDKDRDAVPLIVGAYMDASATIAVKAVVTAPKVAKDRRKAVIIAMMKKVQDRTFEVLEALEEMGL